MATLAEPARSSLILTQSKLLRLITLFLFYFTQGFPVGVFFYALPAWMSAGGASTGDVAAVVAAAGLPWSLKLINGFIIDRYTYLPMGRRRIWIISAQSLITVAFLAAMVVSPLPTDIAVLTMLGFAANAAVTFQDVGIDSLAVDIMEENERAKAASIMMAAQLLGISFATWAGGLLFAGLGMPAGMGLLAIVPAAVALYGVAIRERENERRLPWTAGESHPRNREVQVDAWWPLLKGAFLAMIPLLSLLLLPAMFARSVAYGTFEAYHPELFTQDAGWGLSQYTDLISASSLISGVIGLLLGGTLVDKVGAQRALIVAMIATGALLLAMGLLTGLRTETWWLTSFIIVFDIVGFFILASSIPLCMKMCVPAVAATQFTVYMALGNLGRPAGSAMAAWLDAMGENNAIYLLSAAGCLVSGAVLMFVRYPTRTAEEMAAAEVLPQGEGLPPKID